MADERIRQAVATLAPLAWDPKIQWGRTLISFYSSGFWMGFYNVLTKGNVCLAFCFVMIMKYCSIFYSWPHNYSAPKSPYCWVFEIIWDTQPSQHTDLHAPGVIRPRSPSPRVAADPRLNLLKPTGHVMHQQFNIQQLYALPTLYLCVLYLSENKQRLVPLTA